MRSASTSRQIIQIQSSAPPKPAPGTVCNGCGVCCLVEPCPLGVLLSLSRVGPCKALRWLAAEQQYRCGALGEGGIRQAVVGRWIAAGTGCDCELEAAPSSTIGIDCPGD